MDRLLAEVDIEKFRANEFVNKNKEIPPDGKGSGFIRKGIVGDWKNYFDDEMNAKWDPWIEIQLAGSSFRKVFD